MTQDSDRKILTESSYIITGAMFHLVWNSIERSNVLGSIADTIFTMPIRRAVGSRQALWGMGGFKRL